jgi:beta-fructofuranosidase
MDRRNFLVSSLLASVALSSTGRAELRAQRQRASPAALPSTLPAALRDKLMHDPLRPQFHLLPKANWMNDPCAPRFYRGEYHVFFQYNPDAAVWGDMHWAHATSPDLIHWQHQPVALAPTPDSYDAFGCFTGSVLPGTETPSIVYTGVTKCKPAEETIRGEGLREVQCMATAADAFLRSWTKLPAPVIAAPPAGVKVTGFRDPCPWKDGGTWYLIVGSGFNKVGGAVLLYRSSDGHAWEYLHPLAQGRWSGREMPNPVDSGEMWECPDFFPLGEKHVLLYSTERMVYWEVGTYDRRELLFHSETRGLLDHGNYYAMKSMLNEKGRRVLWGWVTESRPDAELKEAGWAGCMALPRVLTIGPDNTLRMQVPPEFATIQGAPGRLAIAQRAGVVACSFKPGRGAGGLELRAGGSALLSIQYDGAQPAIAIGNKTLALAPDKQGVSTLELWVDGSVVELFVDRREALTTRCYTGAGDIDVAWTGEPAALSNLSVAAVRPISVDRLTS